jgi:hypothetical protein
MGRGLNSGVVLYNLHNMRTNSTYQVRFCEKISIISLWKVSKNGRDIKVKSVLRNMCWLGSAQVQVCMFLVFMILQHFFLSKISSITLFKYMYSKAVILSKKNNFEPTQTLIKAAFDHETSSESRPRCEHFPGIFSFILML